MGMHHNIQSHMIQSKLCHLKCMEYEAEGASPRGRPKKIWREIRRCMPWIVLDGWSR